MSVANPSFEVAEPGNPGLAQSWTLTTQATAQEIAGYDGGTQAAEDFESQWSSNESYVFGFTVNLLAAAEYQTQAPVAKLVENFEEFWSANQLYIFGLGSTVTATYDGEDAEDFEEQWSSNESYVTEFGPGALATAAYDGEAYEDFEEQWSSNQSYIYAFTNGVTLSAAFLDNFEGTWTTMATV